MLSNRMNFSYETVFQNPVTYTVELTCIALNYRFHILLVCRDFENNFVPQSRGFIHRDVPRFRRVVVT